MHYVGTLESGAKFDSSYDRSEPFKFQIGVGQMIKGWEEGVLGMCVGEKRKLIVHPALGYGDQGADDIIQGGATLYFEVELIDTEEGPTPVNVFKQISIDAGIALRLNSFHQSSIDDPVGEILSIVFPHRPADPSCLLATAWEHLLLHYFPHWPSSTGHSLGESPA